MAVHFLRGRMHVGWRRRDWTDVWYTPIGVEDDDGGADIALYKYLSTDEDARQPMEGEVHWHPPFNRKIMESDSAPERVRLQKQFLTDAYKYLSEKDPRAVEVMELNFEAEPQFARLQGWYKSARKWKRTNMRAREAKRRKATEMRRRGATEAQIRKDLNSDSSDDDSAYDSDEDRPRPPPQSMAPPPRPSKKRKAMANGSKSKRPAPKKSRPDVRDSTASYQRRDRSSELFMSGGRGSQSQSQRGNDNDIADDSASDNDMDTRDPNERSPLPTPPPTGLEQRWSFDNLPSTDRPHVRSNSVVGSSAHSPDVRNSTEDQDGAGHSRNGLGTPHPMRQNNDGYGGGEDEETDRRAREFNGDFADDEAAIQEAMRQSQAPSENHGQDRNEDDESKAESIG